MKYNEIEYKGISYKIVFNLNVMEEIQDEYGSLEAWGNLTDAEGAEPNMKAVKFGLSAMINEGIEIDNEDNEGVEGYKPKKKLTPRQVGRLLTELGFSEVTAKLNQTVIDSTKSDEKN